jgi:hypothetical protein
MRAREFIYEFAPSPLAGALKQAVAVAQQKSPAGQSPEIAGRNKALIAQGKDPAAYDEKFKALGGTTPNPNQAKTPTSTTGATGTADAKNATPGGTQTPQPAPGTPPEQKQQMGQAPASGQAPAQPSAPGQKGPGVLGSFISGMTGGKASSVGGLAGMGVAKAMGGLGLDKTAGAIGTAMSGSDKVPTTQDLQTTLKPGAEVKVPGMDNFKVGKIDNTGIELTGAKFGKIKVDPKTLAGK